MLQSSVSCSAGRDTANYQAGISITNTQPMQISIPLYFSNFKSSTARFKSLLDTVNSSESLNPPPHNTQLMQNKIFTTCKICPTPKFWVVYASGAGWLGGDVGDQNIRIKGQTSLSFSCQLSVSGLVSADNTNNPSDVQVDWIPDGWYRPSNWCKWQIV